MKKEEAADAPIAVIGVGALYPGSPDTDGFWRNILNGTNLISETPPSHWLISDYFDPDQSKQGKTYSKFGGFLQDVPFDPLENAIPPANLSATDTAQLLALIVAKRTLHDACGLDFTRIDRDRVSVILGVASATELAATMAGSLQYPVWRRAMLDAGLAESDVERVVGIASESYAEWNESTFPGLLGNVVAGRIANRFGFGGANCVVDAACASSLGAVRMAAQELALGHADMVLTGGVDALNDIFMFICFSRTPAMSPSGKVRPFDKFADGTLLGEGVGMLALRRLADAERDGDRIYAVLRGIGASSDGRAKSIYAPRAEGQMKALERAYRSAGYGPDTVELVEAHGTGTIAGDLAELESLQRVFRQSSERGFPWAALGSVKSQIGHTKGAAGAASLIKAVLALHHKVLPPTINVEEPHEAFREPDCPLYLNTQLRPWIRSSDHPRRASVSSFGFGGSNFHAALEEYVGSSPRPALMRRSSCELFLFSAADRPSLDQALAAAVEPLSRGKSFASVARASQLAFDKSAAQRLAVVASTPEELRKLLDRFVAGDVAIRGLRHASGPPASGAIAFLFPGQGSQYVNMGAGLACAFDLARSPWDALAGGPLAELARIVFSPPSFDDASRSRQAEALTATDRAQPAIAACSLSYLSLLRAAGIQPDMAGGHSFGEITALCAAGAIAADALMAIASERGRLMAQAARAESGAMLAAFASRSAVEAIEGFATSGVVVANHNAPSQVALAGSVEDVDRFKGVLSGHGIKFSALPVAAAFHSPLVAKASAPLRDYLRRTPFRPLQIPVYSNLTAKPYPSAEAIPDLLADQIAAPVRFVEQIEAMYAAGARVFVEVGPGNVLAELTRQCLEGRAHIAVSLDGRENSDMWRLWAAMGRLAITGVEIDLAPFWAGYETEPADDGPRSPATVHINGSNFGKRYPAPERKPKSVEPAPSPAARPGSSSPSASAPEQLAPLAPLVRDDFGLKQSKIMNLIDSQIAEREAEGKPDSAFPRPAPETPMPKQLNAPPSVVYPDRADERISLIADIVRASSEAHQAAQNAMASAHLAYLRATEAAIQALGGGGAPALSSGPQGSSVNLSSIAPPLEEPRFYDVRPPEPPAFHGYSAPSDPPPKSGLGSQPSSNGAAASVAPPEEHPRQKDRDVSVNDLVLGIVARETGYPADMLRPEMSLESDLGIDSIKRVEILAAVKAAAPDLPDIAANELAGLATLGSIAARLAKFADSSVAEPPPAAPSPDSTEDLTSVVLAIVARETGYPVEMLTPEMNLESDLGIDSIKRVEILSAVREAAPGLPDLQAGDLIGLSTLGAISARLQGSKDSPAGASAEEQAAPRAPELRRFALELVVSEPVSAAAPPALASILGGPDELSQALVAALQRRGVNAHRDIFPPPEADAAILLHGLIDAAPGALAEQAVAAARGFAPRASQRGGLFMTVHDAGGDFAFSGRCGERAWRAGLAGLAKTAAREWPLARVKAIDLECADRPVEALAEILADELLCGGDELEIGLSAAGRRVALREEPRPLAGRNVGEQQLLPENAALVVTGGARGVTAECIVQLARATPLRLALLGRSALVDEPEGVEGLRGPDLRAALSRRGGGAKAHPQQIGALAERIEASREVRSTLARLEAIGCEAVYEIVDAADAVAVARVLGTVRKRWGRIDGIVHGAGQLADRAIAEKTAEDVRRVFAPKVEGLRALLSATETDPLRLIALFSSVAARYGNAGQSAYAMANDILNKVARVEAQKRGSSCLVRAFGWGPWDGGMVTPALRRLFAQRGVPLIAPDEGARAFVHAILHADPLSDEIEILIGDPGGLAGAPVSANA